MMPQNYNFFTKQQCFYAAICGNTIKMHLWRVIFALTFAAFGLFSITLQYREVERNV